MTEFLIFGSFAFWAFWIGLLIAVAVLVGLTDNDCWGWATAVCVGTFALLAICGIFNLYKFATQHPALLIEDVIGYLGAALFWGTFKWWRYCKTELDAYEAAKNDFLLSRNATNFNPELRVVWTEKLKNSSRYDRYHVLHCEALEAKLHKEKIITWMYLWPFSVLGYVGHDFVRKLWDILYETMTGVYTAISKNVWQGVESDFASEEDIAIVKATATRAVK